MLQVLWIDKHRPRKLENLYHPQITGTLVDLAKTNDFPHIIFYGPEGAGKKTRVVNFIQQVYGVSSLVLNQEMKSLKLQNPNKVIEFPIISSNYHIQITPADNEYDDRHIIQKVVKDIAATNQINHKSKKFKILVINQADRLSKDAQGSLRRTMQKYMATCRMILICKNIHKLIMPIRSRCVNLRIPAPSLQTVQNTLKGIAKEQLMEISEQSISKIARVSGRNLRDAICQLECFRHSKKSDFDIMHPYKPQIKQIFKLIMNQQSPAQLQKIRGILYDLLVNCIEGTTILKNLMNEIVESDKIRQDLLKGLIHKGAQLEKTMCQGSKPIVHLECFVANAMEAVMITKQNI